MSEIEVFKTPYTRPEKFSNPHNHFSNEKLEGILDIADLDMTWSAYSIIFHLTPIASYQECCYFLPFVLQYIEKNPDGALDCFTEIVYFISENINNLKADDLLEKTRNSLQMCLATWTKNFIVEHYDKEACRKKQWTIDHDDIVENSQMLIETLDAMVFHKSLANIAFDFVEEVCSSQKDVQCAWYLELCNVNKRYNVVRDEELKNYLTNKKHITRCSNIIKKTSFMNQIASPTYWNDVCKRLNIV